MYLEKINMIGLLVFSLDLIFNYKNIKSEIEFYHCHITQGIM
jgi:hypothetical protein